MFEPVWIAISKLPEYDGDNAVCLWAYDLENGLKRNYGFLERCDVHHPRLKCWKWGAYHSYDNGGIDPGIVAFCPIPSADGETL